MTTQIFITHLLTIKKINNLEWFVGSNQLIESPSSYILNAWFTRSFLMYPQLFWHWNQPQSDGKEVQESTLRFPFLQVSNHQSSSSFSSHAASVGIFGHLAVRGFLFFGKFGSSLLQREGGHTMCDALAIMRPMATCNNELN